VLEPDFPDDEEQRLATLQSLNILDTAAEERFDRLTRMARRLFGVPIALVSLVDKDRQWFKSSMGLEARETPRDISFCGHTILDDASLVVPDTNNDTRFADNPLVTEDPSIRFYAGSPLAAPNGSRLGTLCIIDRKPRNLDDEDIEALEDLAAMAEAEIAAVQTSTMDELTDISNRRGFVILAEQALSFCARHDIPATLVFIDLDGFKPINDTFGHAEGDQALISFAREMKDALRESDIFARLGGDEFIALLLNSELQPAMAKMESFKETLDAFNRKADRGYDLAFSCGAVAYDPEKHETLDALMAAADARMYEVKKAG